MSQQRIIGSWQLQEQLGQGSFAVVWRAIHTTTGQVAAVKEVATAKLNRKLRESLASEVSVLQRTSSLHCVSLLDIVREEGRLFLVLEFCGGGDLAHYLRRFGHVPEATAHHLLRQLAEGLRVLRAQHVVHRDLKPQNLLLSDTSATPQLKIADFGFARQIDPQGLAETLCGSPLYMAPEILQFHKYDAKADLWSVGAILFELLAGRPPYTGVNHLQLLHNIERGEGGRLPEAVASVLSPQCKQLLHGLLRRNPHERMGYEEFFAHPFFATIRTATTSTSNSSQAGPPSTDPSDPSQAGVVTMPLGGGITLHAVMRLPSCSPPPAGPKSPSGDPASPSFDPSQQPGSGQGQYMEVDLGPTPTPSPPPLCALPDLVGAGPKAGALSVIEEGDWQVVSSGSSPPSSANGSLTLPWPGQGPGQGGGVSASMGSPLGGFMRSGRAGAAMGRGRRAWDALARVGPSLLPLHLQLPPRLVASAASQLRGAVAAGVAAAAGAGSAAFNPMSSASSASAVGRATERNGQQVSASALVSPTQLGTPQAHVRDPPGNPAANPTGPGLTGQTGAGAPPSGSCGMSAGAASSTLPRTTPDASGAPVSVQLSGGGGAPVRLSQASLAHLIKLPELVDREGAAPQVHQKLDLVLRVLLIIAEQAASRWDAAVARAEMAGELAAASVLLSSRRPSTAAVPPDETCRSTFTPLCASTGQSGGASPVRTSQAGVAHGPCSCSQFGSGAGYNHSSSHSAAAGPGSHPPGAPPALPSAPQPHQPHQPHQPQQSVDEWQGASVADAAIHTAAEAAAAAATARLRAASAELLSYHLLASQLLRQALALGRSSGVALPPHQAALLQGHARTVLGPLHERVQVAARHAAPGAALPWPAQVLLRAAVSLARGAALDELLGTQAASVQGYAKAADLMLFGLLGELETPDAAHTSRCAQTDTPMKGWSGSTAQQRPLHCVYAAVKIRLWECLAEVKGP